MMQGAATLNRELCPFCGKRGGMRFNQGTWEPDPSPRARSGDLRRGYRWTCAHCRKVHTGYTYQFAGFPF